jgi:starvation-inducible DNA-binding protein
MEPVMPASPKTKQHPQSNSLVALLNQSLANTLDLKLATKQAHWNVKGEDFIALHELFDKAASEIDEYADMIAERAVQLGGTALGTSQIIAKKSELAPYPTGIQSSKQHVAALAASIAAVAEGLRKAIDTSDDYGDAVTADLYTEVTRGLDKLRWFVESNLPA